MKFSVPSLFRSRQHYASSLLLGLAIVFLLLAIFVRTVSLKHDIHSYILVADITQSMNVIDVQLAGKPVTRLAYMQNLMHEIVAGLPCGTRVSVGLFAGVSVAALYTPIEVCSNFAAIQDSIEHLDWRAGWSGNSRLRESLFNLARVIRAFPEPAQVVFFTDGEEAPKLHVFNTRDLSTFQGGNDWLLVGIGGDAGTAIPKLDEKNQLIGYWAGDSFAMQPGIAQISEANIGVRSNNVAGGESDRYLSRLDEPYLQNVAKEINGFYLRGTQAFSVLQMMQKQKPLRRAAAPVNVAWLWAGLACCCILLVYLPRRPSLLVKELSLLANKLMARIGSVQAKSGG